jgi:hypothetical protein
MFADGGGLARPLDESKRGFERAVSSVPPSSSVPTKPAEQEYHHYDDQERIRIHGPTLLNFRGAVKWNSYVDRCWTRHSRCFGALSGSENTLPSVVGVIGIS